MLVVVRRPLAQDEARGQQRDAAEQDRDRREAGERKLAAAGALGAGLDLTAGLGAGLRGAGSGLLLAEDALVAVALVSAAVVSSPWTPPYWPCAALSCWLEKPLTARAPPLVLSSPPKTSMAMIASRERMNSVLLDLRARGATRSRTRCLIRPSSRSEAVGRSAWSRAITGPSSASWRWSS